MFHRHDPGDCPICGTAHCACGGGPIEIAQLPARDAAARALQGAPLGTSAAPVDEVQAASPAPLVCDVVQAGLSPGSFTSGTYRGQKRR